MRKLEAVTKEIVDELGYLQRREMRMRDTNGGSFFVFRYYRLSTLCSVSECWVDMFGKETGANDQKARTIESRHSRY